MQTTAFVKSLSSRLNDPNNKNNLRTILQGRGAAKQTVVVKFSFVNSNPGWKICQGGNLANSELSSPDPNLRLSWQVRPADEEEVAHIFKIQTWTKILMKSKFGKR